MLEANLPIRGLTTLGVVDFGLDPIDVAWLLQRHIAGQHDGFTGHDPEFRDRFLQCYSATGSDTRSDDDED